MKKLNDKIKIIFLSTVTIVTFSYIITTFIYFSPNDEILLPATYEKKPSENISPIPQKQINNSEFTPRLTIPSLKISTKIQNVGITKRGNMSTPNNFFDVGLYKYGTYPGEKGSAIIAGHVNNGLGFKAVFGNLNDIKIGDDIYVEMIEGKKVHFTVISSSEYDYNSSADTVFNQNDGYYLKLITCSGTWIPEFHTHDKRLVVTAIKSEI